MGYLICDKCGGQYELKDGESPDDFDKCECGGKLNYSESPPIIPEKKNKENNVTDDNSESGKSNGPKKGKNKYLLIGVVGIVIAIFIIGGYYAYGMYAENKYYENYRLQYHNSVKAEEKWNQSINSLSEYNLSTMTQAQLEKEYPEMIRKENESLKNLDEAISYHQKSINFEKEMLHYASTDYQKDYANLLINQSELWMKEYDLYKKWSNLIIELITAVKNKDTNKINAIGDQITDIKKQIDAIDAEIIKVVDQREDIRANHPDFTTRLDKEVEIAKNATM